MKSIKADFFQSVSIILHSRIHAIILWLVIALVTSVLLADQFSARQSATVSLDVGISVIRLAIPLLIILLTQELLSREFERKLYLTSFTYPRGRNHWLFGRVSAILFTGLITLILLGIILALLVKYAGSSYHQATPVSLGLPYLVTLSFITIDMLVVAAIATLLAISAKTPSFVLIGTIGFTIIARSYTPIIELLRHNPYVVSDFSNPRIYQDSVGLIAFLLPDLGRLDVRMISLYDKMTFMPPDWPILITATFVYVVALLGLSAWILNKREFH